MTMLRRSGRLIDLLSIGIVAWMAMVAVPLEWFWIDPGEVIVADTTTDQPAAIYFERTIRRDFLGRYSVTINPLSGGTVACEDPSGIIKYRRTAYLPEPITMAWWAPRDTRCSNLQPPGVYVMTTCWTGYVLGGMVPAKRTCRTSNPFKVTKPEGVNE